MKLLQKIFIPLILTALLFTACEKENLDEITPVQTNYDVDTVGVNSVLSRMKTFSTDTIFLSCLKMPLPVGFRQASGGTIIVNNQQEFDAAINNPDSLVDFVYPVNALVNDSMVAINQIEDLATAIIACSFRPTQCSDLDPHVVLFYNGLNIFSYNKYEYDINYPVTIIVDGISIVLNNDDDYIPAIGGNPSRPKDAELVYPITVTQFGRTITLNNDNDVCLFYETLEEPCANKPPHIQFFFNEGSGTPSNCAYFINYPVDITMNGMTRNIQSRGQYLSLLNSTPTAYNSISLVYPVSVEKFNNNQNLSFSSASDICQYLDNCQ